MLPKVNKLDMSGTMESIEEYLRSHHGIMRAPLACIVRKTIIVQIHGDYPKYETPDDKIIAMLHLSPDKNKLQNEQSAQSVKEHTEEYKIEKRSVYDILDQIYNNTDLYPYVRQHKPRRNGREAFYAIGPKPC